MDRRRESEVCESVRELDGFDEFDERGGRLPQLGECVHGGARARRLGA